MFKNTLDSTKGLDHISAVRIKIPQLTIVALMSPPEWVDAQYLILLEDGPNSPTTIIRERVTVLAEKSVDTGNASVPRIFEILEG